MKKNEQQKRREGESRRDADFMAACRREMQGDRMPRSARELAARVAGGEAPEFYLTYEYAYRALREYRRTGRLPRKSHPGVDMWKEIALRVELEEQKRGRTFAEAVAVTLEGPAPRFYIRSSTAERLYNRLRRENKRKRSGK